MLNNDPLFQKLLALKTRPALWLGKKSLLALEALVHGYLDACFDFQQGASTIASEKTPPATPSARSYAADTMTRAAWINFLRCWKNSRPSAVSSRC